MPTEDHEAAIKLRPPEGEGVSLSLVALYCLVIALLFTLLSGYAYGTGTHIEELPLVRRALDPTFCQNDFFINESQEFSPATFYVVGVAALASVIPLPAVMFGLTILINWATVFVTYLATRDLMDASDLTAMIATTITASVASIRPGGGAQLMFAEALPNGAVGPLVLLTLWMGLRRRYVVAGAAAILALLLHPTLGLAGAAIGIGGALLVDLIEMLRSKRAGVTIAGIVRGAAALAVVMLVGSLVWLRNWDTTISLAQFFEIQAVFRAPHHRLPSTFNPLLMFDTAAFMAALAVGLAWMVRRDRDRSSIARRMASFTLLTLGLLVAGYVFVEVWPIRSVVALAAFRFVLIPKWLGFMIFAGTITHAWRRTSRDDGVGAMVIFAANGMMHGTGVLLGEALMAMRQRLASRMRPANLGMLSGIGLLLAAVLWAWRGDLREIALLCIIGGTSLLTLAASRRATRAAVLIGAVLVVLATIRLNAWHTLPFVGDDLRQLAPTLTLRQSAPSLMPVSDFARGHTAKDAIFVTPPDFATFRVSADRAIVVDFKCVPFGDEGMAEWYKRIKNCYGPIKGGGFDAQDRIDEAWKDVSDVRLQEIARQWNADYAVLHAGTQTDMPRVYEGPRYTVVDLRGQP